MKNDSTNIGVNPSPGAALERNPGGRGKIQPNCEDLRGLRLGTPAKQRRFPSRVAKLAIAQRLGSDDHRIDDPKQERMAEKRPVRVCNYEANSSTHTHTHLKNRASPGDDRSQTPLRALASPEPRRTIRDNGRPWRS